jgi:hypothetical protein
MRTRQKNGGIQFLLQQLTFISSLFHIWYLQTLHENYMTETCSKNCEPIEYIDVTFLISILLSSLKGYTYPAQLTAHLVLHLL